jgi:hypothetical protein
MIREALKVRNTVAIYSALSELQRHFLIYPRGDESRFARRFPLAIIFRAFGAQSLAPTIFRAFGAAD